MDTVYVAFRHSHSKFGPPPSVVGVGATAGDALRSAGLMESAVRDWLLGSSSEARAYFSVRAYDMTQSPPQYAYRADLSPGGGPVKESEMKR